MFARKILITAEVAVNELPNIIKNRTLEELIEVGTLEKRSKKKSTEIILAAKKKGKRIARQAHEEKVAKVAEGYEQGVKEAQIELAKKMTELASVSSQFMGDIESRIVDIVFSSLSEIVSKFEDRMLVEEVVKKSASQFQSCGAVTLWVSPNLKNEFNEGLEDLVAPASLSIKGDASLAGGQCRIDNGRMVVVGDSAAQVECIRVALKNRISVANRDV